MFVPWRKPFVAIVAALILASLGGWYALRPKSGAVPSMEDGPSTPENQLESRFVFEVKPFVERYCAECHGAEEPKSDLDLTRPAARDIVNGKAGPWSPVLDRLQSHEMPPEDAAHQPSQVERTLVIAWLRDVQEYQARNSGDDPGPVLARRLSNAEYDYTIRDLTGVDMRPTREFPVDPANEAGFDNSGESLTVSPALLKKYLGAARSVADRVVLKPDGFDFAPHPVVADTDRDKYCVQRIVDFYARHTVDLADYFHVAWKYRHRGSLGRPEMSLDGIAVEAGLSGRYLVAVWKALTEGEAVGPLAVVRSAWNDLPKPERADAARDGCRRLSELVGRMRRRLKPRVNRLHVNGISNGSQPLVLWHNRQSARLHGIYSGEPLSDMRDLAGDLSATDAALSKLLAVGQTDAVDEGQLRAGLELFCAVFPDAFVVSDRGLYSDPKGAGKGRPLTAGFHLMQGYFRDDGPLCEWILDQTQRRELDALWFELNFIAQAPQRQYKDFIFFERAEPPRFLGDAEFDFARSEDKDAVRPEKIERLASSYLAKARKQGARDDSVRAISSYFTNIASEIRTVERARRAAEPSHLKALLAFAERAYRRPLTAAERDDLLAFYRRLREQDELGHEDAVRDALASVLLSPHFCYRFDLVPSGRDARPLSDYELASRLSYFLWSSMPDAELLDHARAGDLHATEVLTAQVRRMLRDPKVRGLATQFGGNWLDFRRFEEHNGVDRARFPTFTNELRQAMFEEPIRYLMDVAQHDRSVMDLLYGDDTFVNRALARHYGTKEIPTGDDWIHLEGAGRYRRGGVLPMAVFLTKNAPGLRTSPVKRGYWVVRRLLGETIPPPPPNVPELPKDEAKLGDRTLSEMLARHRADKSCAACHRRFDSVGLVFENYGPIGELRDKDLGGHTVQTEATFPDGQKRDGLSGLRAYVRGRRQEHFIDNLCRKLLSYALGRGIVPSDKKTLSAMRTRLKADGYAFGSLVEAIVTSPQFSTKRGREQLLEP